MESQSQVAVAPDYDDLLKKYENEKKKTESLQMDLKNTRENNIVMQKHVEQEEEFIINKLIKKLEQLKKEKSVSQIRKELSEEDELLSNTLQKRLEKLAKEKIDLENKLEAEQEYIVNRLRKQLEQLTAEKAKLYREKVDLENQLEAEQEYIMNKLQKQVSKLGSEKASLQKEKADLQRQVSDLASSVSRLTLDRVKLEQQMEAEEESIVNRLQRRIEALMQSQRSIEQKLEARGISLSDLGISSAPPSIAGDNPVDWSYVYARSPSSSSMSLERTSLGRRASVAHSPPGVAPSGAGQCPGIAGALVGTRRERPVSAASSTVSDAGLSRTST